MRPVIAYLVLFILCTSVVTAQPVANFSATGTSGCSPLTVQFLDNSTGAPTSWNWAFGNGNTSVLQNPSAVYVVPGIYHVTLTVTNGAGTDSETKNSFVTVFTSPIASFSQNTNGGCVPLTVQFTSTSTPGSGAINAWLWDFGDGNISTQQNPAHTYTSSGAKNVSLTVTDANGCFHTFTQNGAVNVTQSHQASYTVTNPIVCSAPSTHTFTASVSPPNASYTYEWTTTTAQTSTAPNPTFTFNTTGSIGVTLKVTAPGGCAAYVIKSSAVMIADVQADFSLPAQPYCAGKLFTFKCTTTPDTPVMQNTWLVNNVVVSNSRDLQINLPTGLQTIKLISTIGTCTDTVEKTITVNPNPVAAFTVTPNSICFVPVLVNFTNNSTGGGLTYQWDFGNSQTSSLQQPSINYTVLQSYQVQLKVTSGAGCVDSTLTAISVTSPTADVVALNVKRGCKPYMASFSLTNAAQFSTFNWTVNNTTIGSTGAFNHQFNDTGIYVVKLAATTAAGCISEVYDTVRVGQVVPFDFLANKFSGCYSTFNPVQLSMLEFSGLPKLEYVWQWKNGGATGKNVSVNLTDTGLYTISASVNFYGCVNTVTKVNYINIYPALARMGGLNIGCTNDTILFDATYSYGANRFFWDLGDGTTSTAPFIRHKYDSAIAYQARLIVLDTVYNCPDTINIPVQVPQLPTVDFVVEDSLGCSPLLVTMRSLVTTGTNGSIITNADWLFTSGETAFGTNATASLVSYGWRGVSLTLTDARGCVYSATKDSVARVAGGSPKLTLDKNKGCTPLRLVATDSSTTDFPVRDRTWRWTATDIHTLVNVVSDTFVYTTPTAPQSDGYIVEVRVTDTLGCSFFGYQKVIPSNPVPEFTVSRATFCGVQQLNVAANTSPDKVLAPATYVWNLGGGNIGGSVLNRNYLQEDTVLNYRLVINDSNGCVVAKDTSFVILNKRPHAGFFATPNFRSCYLPVTPVQFTDTSIIGNVPIVSWNWRIGNNTSLLRNPQLTFPVPGKYDVQLIVQDSVGCRDTLRVDDYINMGGPTGTFNLTTTKGCEPLTVAFHVNSPNAALYIWDLGNGLVDTVQTTTFSYTYTDANTFYPKLTLVDSSLTCAYGFDADDSVTIYPLPQVGFTTDKRRICYNTEVTFTNTTPNKSVMAQWKWKIDNLDSSTVTDPWKKVFMDAGLFTISLVGIDTNGCTDTLVRTDEVEVFKDVVAPRTPKAFRATVDDDTHARFEFDKNTEHDFLKYRVKYNYQLNLPLTVDEFTATNDTVFIQANINTKDNPYSYAVSAVDVCGNESPTSIKHTTMDVEAVSLNNAIQVSWTPYEGFGGWRYEVWRNNPDSGTSYRAIRSVATNINQITDTSITCFTTYFYRIKAVSLADTNIFSWSDTSGAAPVFVATLPGTEMVRATVVDDKDVLVQWRKRDFKISFRYVIYRMRDDETTPTFYTQTKDTFLLDEQVLVDEHSYSYWVYLNDDCGGLSLISKEAKTILLGVDLRENELGKYDPVVFYSRYKEWEQGVLNYSIEFYYDSSRVFSKVTELTDTTYYHKYMNTQQRQYCYQVTAFEQRGNEATSVSNTACIETKPRLYIPSAFTVNQDGINEKFTAGGIFIDSFHMTLYDRWGNKVFETFDIDKGWDGTYEGQPSPSGVYVYIAEATGPKSQQVILKGNVTLIR